MPAFGADRVLVVRDVPAAVFLFGLPEDTADRAALERWLDQVLARVAVRPRLSVDLVRRLGSSRDTAGRAYLLAIGWLTGPASAGVAVSAEPASAEPRADWLPALVDIPARAIRQMVERMAERWSVPPSELLTMPISEFIVNVRLMTERAGPLAHPSKPPDGAREIPVDQVWQRLEERD